MSPNYKITKHPTIILSYCCTIHFYIFFHVECPSTLWTQSHYNPCLIIIIIRRIIIIKSVTSWRLPRSKFSPNSLHQFPRSKSITSWCRQKSVASVVSFPKFHYNDLFPTSCGLVGTCQAAVSLTSP